MKPWSVPYLLLSLVSATLIGIFGIACNAHAAQTINWVTLDGGTYSSGSPYTVIPGQMITVVINGTLTGSSKWLSSAADFNTGAIPTNGPGWNTQPSQCINITSPAGGYTSAGTYTQSFIYTVQATPTGTLNAFFGIFNNLSCGGGSGNATWANAIVVVAPTTTLATGTDPAAATVAPGAAATDVNLFTLQTNSGTETVSSVTVSLSTSTGVGRLAITNNAGTELGFTTSPATGSNTISVAGMSATTTLANFRVRITPLSHALMPAVPGASYAITAPVTAWVGGGTHTHTGSDTNTNALTIDNASPANVSAAYCTAGDGQVTLNWTIPADADFNSSVALRNSSAVADTPVEGTTYIVGNTIGTSTVRCVVATPTATCIDTGLSNGTAYHYKLFAKDNNGNYSATGVVPGGSPCTPTSAAPGSFSAFETSTAAGAITGKIFTKLAGIGPFGLDVVAISGGAQLATFNNNVKVELLANTGTAGSGYGADNCPTSGTVLQTIASTAISGGRSTVSFAAVASASRDVRVRISYPTAAPTVTTCSTDSFAIRPQGFTVTSSNANADASGTSTVATPVVKAGSAFALTATAVAGYSTTPLLDASKASPHAGAVATGIAAGTFGAANPVSGAASGAGFTYSEVGYFRLDPDGVYDDQFTAAVDASPADCTADFSNALVGGKYGCKFGNDAATGYFGRFVPDRFALTPGSLIDRAGINTGSSEAICASSFTYMGEDLKTTFTLTAQNSTPATTQNYTGGHAAFVLTTWSNFAFTASSGTLVQGTVAPSGAWGSAVGTYGTAAVSATHKITRPAAPAAPYTAFSVSAQPSYTDGTATIALAASTATHAGTSEQRYGRLRLLNAYGSELLPLRVPVRAEYFNGTTWTLNAADSCTSLLASAFALSGGIAANTSASAVALSAGSGTLTLAKPSPVATGSVDVAANLGAGGSDQSCLASHGGTAANVSWLRGFWAPVANCNSTAAWAQDPSARIRFGAAKAPYIYMRERY